MSADIPGQDTVYQFQPVADDKVNRLEQLERGKLWVSDPASFNDPFDLRLYIRDLTCRGPFAEEERLREAMACLLRGNDRLREYWLFNDKLLETLEEWVAGRCHSDAVIAAIQSRFNALGVACFTEAWQSPLMWSHYADEHSGFCVAYRVRKEALVRGQRQRFSQQQVQYVSALPEICLSEVLFSPHQVFSRLLATKSIEWAYEREWRLINFERSHAAVALPDGMEMTALIAGIRMTSDAFAQFRATARRLGIPAYRVEASSSYRMTLQPLSEAASGLDADR